MPSIVFASTACKGGVAFASTSPAYTGAGPHLVLGFDLTRDIDTKLPPNIWPADLPSGFPDRWSAVRDYGFVSNLFAVLPTDADYKLAQLALCMSPPQDVGTAVIGTCSYGDELDGVYAPGTPVDEVSATYDFKLFAAKTGRLLTSFEVTSAPGDLGCPAQLYQADEETYKIAGGPDSNAIAAKIRPFVEANVPSR